MARVLNKLTVRSVINLKKAGLHLDGGGLYLRVGATGAKSWVFRYQRRDMGLGGFPAVSLASARQKAAEARELLARGEDPIEARRKSGVTVSKGMTYNEAAERFIEAHERGWRGDRTAKDWRTNLRLHIGPVIGRLPVAAVETRHVLDILEPLWHSKTTTAAEMRSQIERVLDWAKVRGLRSGENPAAWRGHLAHLLPKRTKVHKPRHHPALPYSDVPAFMQALRADTSIAARCLEFQILTAARPGEALGASWDEIDGAVWQVPAERMKAGKSHRVPLSDAALTLLTDLPRISDFCFPGMRKNRPLAAMTVRTMPKRLGFLNCTAHGFRSSFRDWSGELTSFPRELAEMALAHDVGTAVERAYMRSDLFEKRRKLMDAWGDFCTPDCTDSRKIIAFTKS